MPPAASISSAVRFAVPDGASSLRSWWSSTISHSGMCLAIACDASISRTAPIAKLGATKQLALPASAAAVKRVEVEAGGAEDDVDTGLEAELGVAERGVGGG